MPRQKLTDLFVERVKPPAGKGIDYFDASFPGLCLRVSVHGKKAWCLFYRLHGRQRRFTMGRYPAIMPKQARKEAQRALEQVREGIDPADLKKARRDHRVVTFGDLFNEYVARQAKPNLRPTTLRNTLNDFEHNVLPRWRSRPVASIAKADVIALVDGIVDRGAVVQANRTLGRLKSLYRWATAKDLVTLSPAAGLDMPTDETSRDRVLSDDEIRWMWRACENVGWPFGPIARLLLLTAQRRGEVGGMAWAELDLEAGQWVIPRERAKSDREHIVALSALALRVMQSLPRRGELVFATDAATLPDGYGAAKRRIDEAMRLESGGAVIPRWTLHDLRRTTTSGMARLGTAPHVADKVLNHSGGAIRGTAATYNRFQYLDERRDALEAWGRFVEGLIG